MTKQRPWNSADRYSDRARQISFVLRILRAAVVFVFVALGITFEASPRDVPFTATFATVAIMLGVIVLLINRPRIYGCFGRRQHTPAMISRSTATEGGFAGTPEPQGVTPSAGGTGRSDPVAVQLAYVKRSGGHFARAGVLVLYPDRLVHVRSRVAQYLAPTVGVTLTERAITHEFADKLTASDGSVISIPFAGITRIDRRDLSDEGFCIVTVNGDEYRFFGGYIDTVSYNEWSQLLRDAAAQTGVQVAPPEDEPAPQGRLPGGQGAATRVVLYAAAAAAGTLPSTPGWWSGAARNTRYCCCASVRVPVP
jgi:hypothetical protein